MVDVPVLKVQVDSSEYDAFVARVKQFRADEAEAPDAWAKTAEQAGVVGKRFEEMAAAASEQGAAAGRAGASAALLGSGAEAAAATWGVMHVTARRFVGSVGAATRDLAKWERLTTTFSALLGAGGLYGLDSLAAAAASRRRQATGAGVSTGQLAAFQANYGRLGDTGALLAGFNRAATDRTAQQPLQSLGVDPRGKNALQLFAEALPRVKDVVDRTDARLLGPTLGAYHLDQLGFDEQMLRLLKRMSRSEVEEMRRGAAGDASRFDIPDDVGLKWQELETQLTRAGNRIETALADDLVNVAPGLTKVSESLVRLVDTLMSRPELRTWLDQAGRGVEAVADRIGSDAAVDGLKKAVERFKMSRDDFTRLETWFSGHETTLKRTFAAVVGARVGGVLFGPAGAIAGALIGGTGFAPTHVEGDGAADAKQRAGGARGERPTLAQRNAERKGLGDKPYASQGEYDRAEPPAGGSPSATPGDATAYDKDIAGDISGSSTYGHLGEKITPEAFVVHHTGGRGTPQSVMATFNQRGYPAQYIMDRDGKVYRALPEGNRGTHILNSATLGADGRPLSNSNTFGMEVIANNDSDVTPAQVAAARKFYKDLKAKYPSIREAYGHGYLNPGHKEATEGKTITDAIHADENAPPLPVVTPAMAGAAAAKGIPPAQRGFMGGYAGGDAPRAASATAAASDDGSRFSLGPAFSGHTPGKHDAYYDDVRLGHTKDGDLFKSHDHGYYVDKGPGRHVPLNEEAARGLLAAHPNSKPAPAPAVHVTDDTGGASRVEVHH